MKHLLEKKEAEIKELKSIVDLAKQLVSALSNPLNIFNEADPVETLRLLQQAIERYENEAK